MLFFEFTVDVVTRMRNELSFTFPSERVASEEGKIRFLKRNLMQNNGEIAKLMRKFFLSGP